MASNTTNKIGGITMNSIESELSGYEAILEAKLSFWGTSINDVIDNAQELVKESGGETIQDLLWAIAHVADRDIEDYKETMDS